MPEPKDIVLAILGGSVSLSGLLLIFAGFLFGQATAFPSTTDDATINRFRNGGRVAIAPFLASLVVAAISVLWLLTPNAWLYWSVIVGFLLVLFGTAAYGALTVLRYL
jgi:vacuolar-type H+-ATPase subunit I/STV1